MSKTKQNRNDELLPMKSPFIPRESIGNEDESEDGSGSVSHTSRGDDDTTNQGSRLDNRSHTVDEALLRDLEEYEREQSSEHEE